MSVSTKRVFCVQYLSHSMFTELLGTRPRIPQRQLASQ